MINGKSYLAMQAWFTTMITSGLTHVIGFLPQLSFVQPLTPGAAVAISHLIILGIAFIGIPSINDIRVKNEIKAAKKHIHKCLTNNDLSDEQRAHYNQCLIDLDIKVLENITGKINAISNAQTQQEAQE